MAQSIKNLTPVLGPGYDLTVLSLSPASGSVLTAWSLLGILSLSASLSAPLPLVVCLSLSLKINKL